jgi:CheY-like chemotaxis protein
MVVDLMMPVMDGWEFIAKCQQDPAFASVPIVVLTGVSKEPGAHARVLLKKPVNFDNLLKVLSAMTASKTAPPGEA